MSQSRQFLELVQTSREIKNTSFVVDETPLEFFDPEDSIEFHSGRLLLLLRYCSTDVLSEEMLSIKGRTKLAKLDFFLRYPQYLERALQKPEIKNTAELELHLEERERQSIEATMIRYRYGPWDEKYYDVFAYLVAKDLIAVVTKNGIDYFHLTEKGKAAIEALLEQRTYNDLADRCQIIRHSLAERSGMWLKNFIYRHFPEIVGQPIGSIIEGTRNG